ncbi:MAG: hypothetical protein AB7H86_01070 [Blastocatellales bacterium]
MVTQVKNSLFGSNVEEAIALIGSLSYVDQQISPELALLNQEPGMDRVETLLGDSVINTNIAK